MLLETFLNTKTGLTLYFVVFFIISIFYFFFLYKQKNTYITDHVLSYGLILSQSKIILKYNMSHIIIIIINALQLLLISTTTIWIKKNSVHLYIDTLKVFLPYLSTIIFRCCCVVLDYRYELMQCGALMTTKKNLY